MDKLDELVGVMPSTTMYDSYCYQFPTDSGLTFYNHHHHHDPFIPRKRLRETESNSNVLLPLSQKPKIVSSQTHQQPSFFDQKQQQQQQQHQLLFLLHNQQEQYEIDSFIAQHAEKVRADIEEQRVRQTTKLLSVIQDEVERRLKEKDGEIERVLKMNWVLQERVKNLCSENQIWRELAQTNEATAISLRTNLEQVLAAQVNENHRDGGGDDDDAASSCGSNCVEAHGDDAEAVVGKICKSCGVRESIVFLLPCRHLCLCTICGSSVMNCPLCHSRINARVHVNLS
ncbi:hypothetical protein RIF29_35609 [Crotalaria pallida]|uniref:RING-type domain-containing protein n=1 Tax=Crotalaria pallida TaxID=3830 RepID=A0AAN9EAB7_CROPI